MIWFGFLEIKSDGRLKRTLQNCGGDGSNEAASRQ